MCHRDEPVQAGRAIDPGDLLELFGAVELTPEAAVESGQIRGQLQRAGRQLGPIDGHLAATAKLAGYVLVTDDRDFQPLAGEITSENWLV